MEMAIFNFTPDFLTFSNWALEKSFLKNFAPGFWCHLQNSHWFPIQSLIGSSTFNSFKITPIL
jgi:hypothetical protein